MTDESRDPMQDLARAAEMIGATLVEMPARSDGGKLDVSAMIASGEWSERDLPWMNPALFDKFVESFGKDGCIVLVSSDDGENRRGQLLVSEKGIENFRANAAELQAFADRIFAASPRPSTAN